MAKEDSQERARVTSLLREQGLIGDQEQVRWVTTPPPVRREQRDAEAAEDTPLTLEPDPSTMDRIAPTDAVVADAVASMVSPPPVPVVEPKPSRAPGYAALVAALVLLGTFASLLFFGDFGGP